MSSEYYTVGWLIEHEVVHVVQLKEWDLEVAGWMVRDASALMDTVNKAKVPIVVDGSRVPSKMYNVIEANKMFKDNRSDRWGFTVVVGEKNFTQFVAQTMLQLARVELRFTGSLDEAISVLYRVDQNLVNKKINPLT